MFRLIPSMFCWCTRTNCCCGLAHASESLPSAVTCCLIMDHDVSFSEFAYLWYFMSTCAACVWVLPVRKPSWLLPSGQPLSKYKCQFEKTWPRTAPRIPSQQTLVCVSILTRPTSSCCLFLFDAVWLVRRLRRINGSHITTGAGA